MTRKREEGKEDKYPVGNSTTHASNQHHASPLTKPHHLPRNRLRRHKHPGDIDTHHGITILRTIIQCGRLLLDPRSRNEPVHATMLVCYLLHYLV